jgi:hypothetical protein
MCGACPHGKFNSGSSLYCGFCPAGSFADSDATAPAGAGSCTPCPAGKFSTRDSVECSTCGIGRYQDQSGQEDGCKQCKRKPGNSKYAVDGVKPPSSPECPFTCNVDYSGLECVNPLLWFQNNAAYFVGAGAVLVTVYMAWAACLKPALAQRRESEEEVRRQGSPWRQNLPWLRGALGKGDRYERQHSLQGGGGWRGVEDPLLPGEFQKAGFAYGDGPEDSGLYGGHDSSADMLLMERQIARHVSREVCGGCNSPDRPWLVRAAPEVWPGTAAEFRAFAAACNQAAAWRGGYAAAAAETEAAVRTAELQGGPNTAAAAAARALPVRAETGRRLAVEEALLTASRWLCPPLHWRLLSQARLRRVRRLQLVTSAFERSVVRAHAAAYDHGGRAHEGRIAGAVRFGCSADMTLAYVDVLCAAYHSDEREREQSFVSASADLEADLASASSQRSVEEVKAEEAKASKAAAAAVAARAAALSLRPSLLSLGVAARASPLDPRPPFDSTVADRLLPMVLVFSGDGSLHTPFALDSNDVYVRAVPARLELLIDEQVLTPRPSTPLTPAAPLAPSPPLTLPHHSLTELLVGRA